MKHDLSGALQRGGAPPPPPPPGEPAVEKVRREVLGEVAVTRGFGATSDGWEFVEATDQAFLNVHPVRRRRSRLTSG